METILLSSTFSSSHPYREIDFVWARGKYTMNLISWSARSRLARLTGNEVATSPDDLPHGSRSRLIFNIALIMQKQSIRWLRFNSAPRYSSRRENGGWKGGREGGRKGGRGREREREKERERGGERERERGREREREIEELRIWISKLRPSATMSGPFETIKVTLTRKCTHTHTHTLPRTLFDMLSIFAHYK